MASMEETLAPPAASRRKLWPVFILLVALLGAAVMGWVWWSFYALNQAQTYEVVHTVGEARIIAASGTDASRKLAEGTVIETGADGYVTLSLSEGSVLKVLPGTRATVRTARSSGRGDRHQMGIELDVGELTSRVVSDDDSSRRVSLTTKAVNIAVRGTVFTVVQDASDARLTVTEGRVTAAGAKDPEVLVAKNMGTVIRPGEAPLEPVELPPPPQPLSVAAASEAAPDGLEFTWQPVAGISRWQVEIALDEAFSKNIARYNAEAAVSAVAPLNRDGRYFWRVASVDSLGLRGPWSAATPFEHDYYYLKGRQALLDLNPEDAVALFRNAQGNYDAELELVRKRGWVLLRQGELEKAKRQFETVAAVRKDDSDARYGLGVVEMSGNNLAGAESQFDAAVEKNPGNVAARVGLAMVAVRSGRFDEALRQSQAALEIDASHVPALQVASMAAVGAGDHVLASSYVKKILTIEPNNSTALALSQTLDPEEGVKESLSSVKGSVLNAKPVE